MRRQTLLWLAGIAAIVAFVAAARRSHESDQPARDHHPFHHGSVDDRATHHPAIHDDPDHDAAVLDRLDALHDQVVPVTTALAGTLSRFIGYTDRLTAAHERVRAGDHDWITRPVIDSYHTVWFELHEDLLATLGRERSQERA